MGERALLTLHRLDVRDADWTRMDAMPDRVVFQMREWIELLATTQNAEPVLAVVRDGGVDVGYFTGLVVKRLGIRILGSPFPGWTTDYLGFNLLLEVDRRDAARALLPFAFGPLRCLHVELCDRYLQRGDLDGTRYETDCSRRTFVVDLTGSEADVFGRMTSPCRRAVRKAEKSGVRVEVAQGLPFADEYYEQLQGVFARQSLAPSYGVGRVRELIRALEKTDNLLCCCYGPSVPMVAGSRPASSSPATARPISGAARACASSRSSGRTRRSSGSRCGGPGRGGVPAWTWAAAVSTRRGTERQSCGCPGSVARGSRCSRACATRLRPSSMLA